jgi:hypothetical protein
MTSFANKLCAIALVLPGCIPTSGDEADTRGDQHTLTVNWNVKNADGTPHSCAPPFDTLVIVATAVEMDGGYNYQDSVSVTVPCTATGSASLDIYTSGELDFKMPDDPTTYTWTYFQTQEVVIYNTEDSGMNSRADSIERLVTLNADKSVDIELYPEAGFAMFGWQLQSMTTSSYITCAAGDVDQVSFTYRDFYDAAAPMVTDMWNCNNIDPDFPYLTEGQVFDAGNGRSRALAPGSYIGTTRALRSGTEVGREDDSEFTVETGNKVTPLNSASMVILDR